MKRSKIAMFSSLLVAGTILGGMVLTGCSSPNPDVPKIERDASGRKVGVTNSTPVPPQ